MNRIVIRPADSADAPSLAALSGQLGYPSTPAQIAARLAVLAETADAVRVAEVDGQVAGWIHVGSHRPLESEPSAEISGLVVDEAHRGQGIGRLLVEAALAWARERGYAGIRVRSNVVRADAHRFYEGLGFQRVKTQVTFTRAV
ncbi:MAG TPA: GNAT family N-acetyltransferase [Thermoanaerobaculia bacterium]|nr:GNAT family N-acetyltransferase [Thermoanaerobaculia bacterium]